MTRTNRAVDVVRSLRCVARTEQLPFLAAAIAYYAFVSTVPLALLGLAVASSLGSDALAAAVLAAIGEALSPAGAGLLERTLTSDTGREGATLIGVAVLGWSGLRVFRGLDVAFSRIYGIDKPEALLTRIVDAVAVLGAVALATIVAAGIVAAAPLTVLPFSAVLAPVASALVLPIAVLPIYYAFPDRPTTLRGAIPGALLAGVGWSVLAWLFGLYAGYVGSFALYGVLGAVLLALTWFYAAGLLLLLGAALNAVLAGHDGDRQLQLSPSQRDTHEDTMSDGERRSDGVEAVDTVDTRAVDPEEIADLRREIDAVADDLEEKTKAREDLEADLRQYVRWRQRRGHARGWGPYLVLLYGTIMTLGAFYFLSSGWAILAMLVVWLSTLGLYALMLIVGFVGTAVGVPGRVLDRVRSFR